MVEEVVALASEPDPSLVTICYGTFCRQLAAGSWAVGQAKRWAMVAWGVGYFTDTRLDGRLAPLAAVPQPGSELTFIPPPGFKGAEDGPGEAEAVFARYPELLAIRDEVASRGLETRRGVDLALALAAKFFERRFGRPENADWVLMRQVLERLADSVMLLATSRDDRNPEVVCVRGGAVEPAAGGDALPEEVTTAAAAKLLGVSKDTVLKYRERGLLRFRDLAPPGSSRPNFVYPLAAVLELRTGYETESPAPPRPAEPRRQRVKGQRRYKHLDIDD